MSREKTSFTTVTCDECKKSVETKNSEPRYPPDGWIFASIADANEGRWYKERLANLDFCSKSCMAAYFEETYE